MSEVSLTDVGLETHHRHGFDAHLMQPLPFLDEYVAIKIRFDSYEYTSEDLDPEVSEEVCFLQKQDVMLDDNKALYELSPLLSEKGIPEVVHSCIIKDMVNSYSTTRSDYTTESEKDVPVIVFKIILETRLSYDEEEAAAAADDDACRSIPAAEYAVHALEKVILDPAGSNTRETTCRVCLENLHPGLQLKRMPCSHIYFMEIASFDG